MKKTLYLLLSILIISCSTDELNEPTEASNDTSLTKRYIGTLPVFGADDVKLKMYFDEESIVDNTEYAGIQFTSERIHDKEIKVIVDYYHAGNQMVFVPQEFIIKPNEQRSNKLYNVSAYDMFTCPGLDTKIIMKIRKVYYDGAEINTYETVPTSGSISNSFYTFCNNSVGGTPIDYDHDGVVNIEDDCPYTSAGDDDSDNDGCPD
ncbi:hypothetical protein [uncultured Kordia sp.]|uniref:hypothetical protein n=1 Tax=uncultured Kordia sp. TaxID=507699 RepID=UPI00260AF179|nr:hypothetical protein [uncultured Kordia sp.]